MEHPGEPGMTPSRGSGVSVRAPIVWWAALADVAAVLLFVASGRSSHAEALSIVGLSETAWPFLGGLLAGWLVAGVFVGGAWHRALAVTRTGLVVWASTLVVGMLLRVVSGQGTAFAFVVVATVVLCVLLVGWRAVALLVRRLRGRRRTRHAQQVAG